MRRRRRQSPLWGTLLGAAALGLGTHPGKSVGQDAPLPPALEERHGPASTGTRTPAGLGAEPESLIPSMPPAPQPIPGPAAMAFAARAKASETPRGLPINLATAMQLAGARPLDIAVATAQTQQALALLLQAKALWIPSINGGLDYFRHDGVQQNFFTGPNFQKGRQTFFVGGGPTLYVGLADAIFTPLAARRVVDARRADVQSARNDSLFTVARAYFDLQAARGRLLGTDATIARAELLVNFAKGLAPSLIAPLEINRAQAELQSLRQAQQVAVRDWKVASAQLAEVVLLDPGTLLEPIEPPFLQVTLVPSERSPDELMPIAINNRPEIASRRELVVAAGQLLRQEKNRPFLPNMIVTSPVTATGLLAAGNLSSGANNSMGSNGARLDIEVGMVWQLQNGGIGNIGRIRQRRAEQDVASIELTRTVYRVKSEVAQAVARVQTARLRVVQTEDGLIQAIESADKNFIGLRETTRPAGELLRVIVRPQEVVAAIIALETAYVEYSNAVAEYNAAQFDVYHALGQPAQWITSGDCRLMPPRANSPPVATTNVPPVPPVGGPVAPSAATAPGRGRSTR